MGKTLAALLVSGALLLGCTEKPKPQAKLFIDPISGAMIHELGKPSPKPKTIARRPKKQTPSPPKPKEPEIFDPIIIWGKRYETSLGNFEINGKKLNGIILTGEDGKYGSVPLLLGGLMCKERHGIEGYKVLEPKSIDEMYGMNFKLPDKLKNSSKKEVFKRLFVKKRIGNRTYRVMGGWKEKIYDSNLRQLESLDILISETGIRTSFMSEVKNEKMSLFSNFYVPVKIE